MYVRAIHCTAAIYVGLAYHTTAAIVDLANAILSLSPVSEPHYLSAQTYRPVQKRSKICITLIQALRSFVVLLD